MATKPIPHPESRFTVLWEVEPYERKDGRRYSQWLCQCTCGKTSKVEVSRIRNGHVKSCGCLRREMAKARIGMAKAVMLENCKRRRLANAE